MGEGGSLKGGRFLLTNHTIFGWLDCVSMEIFAPRERFFVHHTLWTIIFSQHPSTSLKKKHVYMQLRHMKYSTNPKGTSHGT